MRLSIIFLAGSIVGDSGMLLPSSLMMKEFIKVDRMQPGATQLRTFAEQSPSFTVNSQVGNQEEGRYYFNAAGLAYCPNNASGGIYERNLGPEFKIYKIIEDHILKTKAFIGIQALKKQLIVGFRGTTSEENWELNFEVQQVSIYNDRNVKVHSGFQQINKAMGPEIKQTLNSLLRSPRYRQYSIIMTGHSLGAALATLSILDVKKHFNIPSSQLQLITYGSPRVGNQHFVNLINSLPFKSTRIVNQRDPVPKLPSGIHYVHIQTEMFINKDQTILCKRTTWEDPDCSVTIPVTLDSSDHSKVWDLEFLDTNC